MTTTTLYDHADLLIISILRYFSRSSEVLFNSKFVLYLYILLPIFNSDEIVMSRENSKFFTYAFCKSEVLHFNKNGSRRFKPF
jgi:hypothetical protein